MDNHDFDFSDVTLRSFSGDFGKHKLTDLMEETEDDIWRTSFEIFKRRLGSIDTIWETHPHRLNEAGLVRHSDNSVLTEDTDSFIIGDKVWVGGTKPGQIAYIGETQFAPGEWAGIVLDQPIGKNDGSVGAVRYFQCEPKRGVFSRLSRLTRLPFLDADESTYRVTSTPLNNGARQRGGSPLSPTGSTKSLRKSPSLSASNTSLSSATHVVDFKVGDRVIIKSSQGSKVGTLRFMGTTNFASGEWCGVELDDPRGKNDGSVEGIRYFECRPQFGLFAPVSKVSKSPLKYKPGNCVLHSGAGLPPSGMKRAGSKESMTSMTSSITSATSNARRVRLGVNSLTPQKITTKSTANTFPSRTALQDVLKEKQQHIEQLLKERDLENAEFTRAANHAERAEKQLTTLKAEYEYYRTECEAKLQEFTSVLSRLNIDRDSLLSQLDDEKRKNEDLQFKFEEAAITKGDIEVSNQTNVHRIRDLESQLALERHKIEQLEFDSGKLFEAEEALVKSREEIDSLREDLQSLSRNCDIVQQESTSSAESFVQLKRELENSQSDLANFKVESSKLIANCEIQQQEIITLKLELSQIKVQLQEKSVAFENKIKEDTVLENELRDELEVVKAELASKNTELHDKDEALQLKVEDIRSLKALLETTQIDLNAKSVDVERYQRSKQDAETIFNKEIDCLKKTLKEKIVEREEIEKTYSIQAAQKNAQLEVASKTINHHLEEIQRLKSDLTEVKTNIERNNVDVHERHTRQIAIKESELMALAAELQLKKEELTKCSIVSNKLEDDICVKNGIIDKLRLELESIRKHSETEQMTMLNYTERNSALQLSVGDCQRKLTATEQLVAELGEQKLRLENEMQSIIASRGDYTSELQKLVAAVLEKEHLVATVRNEFTQKLQISQSVEQQLQLQLQKVNEDSERAIINLEEKLKTAQQTEQMLHDSCNNTNAEALKIREDLMIKVNQLQRSLEEKEFALKVSTSDHAENKRYLAEQLERTTAELQKTVDGCQTRINELMAENMNAKNAFTQKSQELIESEAKLKHFISQSQLNEVEIRRVSEEQVKKFQFDLTEKSAQVNQFMKELDLLKRDCQNRNINIAEKDHDISELSVQLENTIQLVNQLQRDKDNLQLSQMEASKQSALGNQQCTDLVKQVAILAEKVELSDKLAQELQMHKTVHQKLLQQLPITEQQKQDLIVRLEGEVNKNGDADKCFYMLELVKNLQASTSDSFTKKINDLQQTIESTRLMLRESQLQGETQKEEILRLQNEMLRVQQEYGAIQSGFPSLDTRTKLVNCPGDHNRLLEEKQQAEGQIQFLNSIIVDIQRKNDEQRATIELLESGFSASAVNDLNLYGSAKQSRQTRMYCDICEVFDDHETEDCPIQANDPDAVIPGSFRSKRAATSSERPYCEICEVFGHCTEDCKEDQTF